LGVQLDTRLSFLEHAKTEVSGAKSTAVALSRLMPNVGGPLQSKRSLLMSVVNSRFLYGTQVWSDSIHKFEKPKDSVNSGAEMCGIAHGQALQNRFRCGSFGTG